MENSIKHSYHIGGMSCGSCVSGVKQKLSGVAGVTSVTVDLGNKRAEVISSEEIKTQILRNALSNTNFTISEL